LFWVMSPGYPVNVFQKSCHRVGGFGSTDKKNRLMGAGYRRQEIGEGDLQTVLQTVLWWV